VSHLHPDSWGITKTLPEFVLAAFPERIEQVLDPALLLPIEELDLAISVSTLSSFSEDSEVRVMTARDCLVSAVRVGLSCSAVRENEREGGRR
jgi:hypothetical protein